MGGRSTKQKELIRNEIKKFNSFFTAEDLHKKVSKKNIKIGIATVYRFLKDLLVKKEINSYLCNRRTIYSCNKDNHCHFICEKTGKVIHFSIDNLNFLKNKIPGSIKNFQLEVRGVCDDCSILNTKN